MCNTHLLLPVPALLPDPEHPNAGRLQEAASGPNATSSHEGQPKGSQHDCVMLVPGGTPDAVHAQRSHMPFTPITLAFKDLK
jgi:hypothetical protein